MQPFSVVSRFPARRRAAQACVACRMRKTRCDAATPRCGFCAMQNIDCVYRDAQQPRVDYNTQVLLERIQLLENRLTGQQDGRDPVQVPRAPHEPPQPKGPLDTGAALDLDVQIAMSHTANANHVYSWPIVQQLLSETPDSDGGLSGDATDIFFVPASQPLASVPSSWRLYHNSELAPEACRDLIDVYFSDVNVFFPLLSRDDVLAIHEAVLSSDSYGKSESEDSLVPPAEYGLLLLVLCLAIFVKSGRNLVSISTNGQATSFSDEEDRLWSKAKLLLGTVSPELSFTAAQCAMLAW